MHVWFLQEKTLYLLGCAHTYKQDQTLTSGCLHSPVVNCKNAESERVAMKLLPDSSTTFLRVMHRKVQEWKSPVLQSIVLVGSGLRNNRVK